MNINNKDNKAFSLPSSPTKQMTNNNGTTSTTTNNTYKTKIKKIYTPTKNNGNKELINKIEKRLVKLHLFAIQQQLYQQHNNNLIEQTIVVTTIVRLRKENFMRNCVNWYYKL